MGEKDVGTKKKLEKALSSPLEDTDRQINIQLRYYLKIDPDTLTDDEWVNTYRDLHWIRTEEAKTKQWQA